MFCHSVAELFDILYNSFGLETSVSDTFWGCIFHFPLGFWDILSILLLRFYTKLLLKMTQR